MCVHVIQSHERIWVCTLAFFFQIRDSDKKKIFLCWPSVIFHSVKIRDPISWECRNLESGAYACILYKCSNAWTRKAWQHPTSSSHFQYWLSWILLLVSYLWEVRESLYRFVCGHGEYRKGHMVASAGIDHKHSALSRASEDFTTNNSSCSVLLISPSALQNVFHIHSVSLLEPVICLSTATYSSKVLYYCLDLIFIYIQSFCYCAACAWMQNCFSSLHSISLQYWCCYTWW